MNQEPDRRLFDRTRVVSLGEAVRRAKMAVMSSDVRRTWILFGDPAIRLKGLGTR